MLTVLAQQSDMTAVIAPDNVFDWRSSQFSKDLLLLNVKQDNR